MLYNIYELGISQIYLSSKKLENIRQWFSIDMSLFQPIEIYNFNGKLRIVDGHSRAFIAWENGVTEIPAILSDNEIVTSELGQLQYEQDRIWCERFGLNDISDLQNRIISHEDYENLWIDRCDVMYNLVCAVRDNKISDLNLENDGLFVYGISENLSTYYCEDINGTLSTRSVL